MLLVQIRPAGLIPRLIGDKVMDIPLKSNKDKIVIGIVFILLVINIIQFITSENLRNGLNTLTSEFNKYKENASLEINDLKLKNDQLTNSHQEFDERISQSL